MAPPGAEVLIAAIVLTTLLLVPVVSRLIGAVGAEISRDVERGLW